MTSSSTAQKEESTEATMMQMTMMMPFMLGFFALRFPAGLALYWVTSNLLTFVQYWLLNQVDTPPAQKVEIDAPLAHDDEKSQKASDRPKRAKKKKSRRKSKNRL